MKRVSSLYEYDKVELKFPCLCFGWGYYYDEVELFLFWMPQQQLVVSQFYGKFVVVMDLNVVIVVVVEVSLLEDWALLKLRLDLVMVADVVDISQVTSQSTDLSPAVIYPTRPHLLLLFDYYCCWGWGDAWCWAMCCWDLEVSRAGARSKNGGGKFDRSTPHHHLDRRTTKCQGAIWLATETRRQSLLTSPRRLEIVKLCGTIINVQKWWLKSGAIVFRRWYVVVYSVYLISIFI